MTRRCYFIDTSYLLELYRVPGRHEQVAAAVIRQKFAQAWANPDALFLPAVCVFELGNIIAQIRNAEDRRRFADILRADIAQSLGTAPLRKYTVIASPLLDELPALLESWVRGHVPATRGLVDAALAERSAEFKKRHTSSIPVLVHIWSRDRALKGVEPDPEPEPFVGW